MNIAFDLDECLISTRAAHEAAYRSLGVVPDGLSRHLPARFWMNDPEKYEAKHKVFPLFLQSHGKLLPTMALFQGLGPDSAVILTGTSQRSVEALVEWCPALDMASQIHCSMGPEEKLAWFNRNQPGVYFDDWSQFVKRVREETRWQAIDVSGF